MKQAWVEPRRWALLASIWLYCGLLACQQGTPLQSVIANPDKQKKEVKTDKPSDEDEKVTPPSNVVGSFLVCRELQQLTEIQQTASIGCGLYREPEHSLAKVSNFAQWRVTGSALPAMSPLTSGSADQVELKFRATDEASLKLAVRNTRLALVDDNGDLHEGVVASLLPKNDRLAAVNASNAGQWLSLWNEGFEGTAITADTALFHDPKTFNAPLVVDWVNPASQTTACGSPMLEVMRWATQGGSTDGIGAAEGLQFIDTDPACWPTSSTAAIRGPSNLALGKDLQLFEGRTYRVTFKVRQQPLPPGFTTAVQGLQLRINQVIVKDLRSFDSQWQEISVDWIAGSGTSRLEWIDVGASDDSIGVLLDDLRVQIQNF